MSLSKNIPSKRKISDMNVPLDTFVPKAPHLKISRSVLQVLLEMRLKARVWMTAFLVHKIAYRPKKPRNHVSCAQADQLRTRNALHVSVKVAIGIGKHP